jgi:PIN domain nuclease of toxin-antitoxin system
VIHVVDTHALTRYFEDLSLLGLDSRSIMTHPDSVLVVPTIALAEARWMIEKKQTRVDWDDLLSSLQVDPRFVVSPLTLDMVRVVKPGLEMHDALICATVILLRDSVDDEVNLITRDKDIRDSGLVQTVW